MDKLGEQAVSGQLSKQAYLVVTIVRLEVVNEGINVLILLLLLDTSLGGRHVVLGRLLVELAALNVGGQRRSAGRLLFSH